MPIPSPPEPGRRRFQFQLGYLIYLLTLFAIGFALVRPLVEQRNHWLILAGWGVYVGLLLAYFAIRIPLLWRRLRGNRRRFEEQRRELSDYSDNARNRFRTKDQA